LALDQRIDRDGRAVDQLIDRSGFEPTLAQAIDDALHEMRRRGQAFGLHEAAGRLVEANEVGERPADIDGNDQHAGTPSGYGDSSGIPRQHASEFRISRLFWL